MANLALRSRRVQREPLPTGDPGVRYDEVEVRVAARAGRETGGNCSLGDNKDARVAHR